MFKLLRKIHLIDIITIIWIILWVIPQAPLMPGYNYIWFVFYGIWFVFMCIHRTVLSKAENNLFLVFVFSMVVMLSESLYLGRTSVFHNQIDQSQIPFSFFVFCYYYRRRGWKTTFNIILSSMPFFTIASITTIIVLIINPFAARVVGKEGAGDDIADGVGGYAFIYTAMLFAVILFFLLINGRNIGKIKIIVILAFFLLFTTLVLLSNFFTATVLLVAAMVAIIVLRDRKKIVPLILATFLIMPFYKTIGSLAIDGLLEIVTPKGKTHDRLEEIKYSLVSGKKADNVDSREYERGRSIDTFLEYPLFGALPTSGMDRDDMSLIGRHSVFLDTYAIWGIVIGSLFIYVLLCPFFILYKKAVHYRLKLYIICYGITYFALLFNNVLTSSMGYVTYFIFPFTFSYVARIDYSVDIAKR